jgi:hypothetical protein
MATVATITYSATSVVSITTTGLANATSRESTAIDNTTTKYIDAQVGINLTTGAGGGFYVYGYGSLDGTNYTENATGSDAAITPPDVSSFPLLAFIPVTTTGLKLHSYVIGSVASIWGGILPLKWGIIISNTSAIALSMTATANTVYMTGITYTST